MRQDKGIQGSVGRTASGNQQSLQFLQEGVEQ